MNQIKPVEWNLSNGIPVILQNFDGPVASFYWWVKTGSADEYPKEAGFAHFLEHMHFKDTDAKTSGKASTGEMARAIESLGGDVNAYTSFDQTVYHVTCASQHWEKVIKVFSNLARPQKFLKEDFIREREVILEELKKNEDSPSRMLFQDLFTGVYPKHPYGKPVIGFVKTLKAATVKELETFYKRQYVSENMGIVLVGPYDEKRRKNIHKMIEASFGKKVIPQRSSKNPIRKNDSEVGKSLSLTKRPFDVKMPSYTIGFRVPDLKHEDIPALDLLASVLGMGEMSRLYQKLFYKESIVTEVGAGLYVPKDPGMVYFTVEVDTVQKIETSLKLLVEEMKRIQIDGPTEEELKRVITNNESERYYAAQSADGIAGRVGFLKFQVSDLSYDQKYIDALKSVSSDQIKEIALKYFDSKRCVGSLMLPLSEKSYSLDKMKKCLEDAFTVRPKKIEKKLKNSKPNYSPADIIPEIIQLESGAKVLYYERKSSALMSIHAVSLGGLRQEELKHQGVSQLLSMTWNKGTKTRSSNAITEMIEGSAASLDGFAGRNTVGLQCVGLSRDWDKLSDLFTDVLLNPTFSAEELNHSKRVTEESLKSIEDHSSALCSKYFLEKLFENHPYGRHVNGTLESVSQLHSKDLLNYHEKWVNPDNLILSVVGNVKPHELFRFNEQLNKIFSEKKSKKTDFFKVEEEKDLKAPRWVDRNLKREQVHIISGGLGISLMNEDRYALRLLSNILGGQSGRLFIELREKKSLAYTVTPISLEGMERGYVGTYIACSPSKKEDALLGIQKVFEDFVKKGPTASEMKRAKEYYLGRRAMDLQGDSSIASYLGLEKIYDLPLMTDKERTKRIESINAKKLVELAEKLFLNSNKVTVCVG